VPLFTAWSGVFCRQVQYDRVADQPVTRLLLPHLEDRLGDNLPTKEKLRRVVSAEAMG
jgi:hypothetical protein